MSPIQRASVSLWIAQDAFEYDAWICWKDVEPFTHTLTTYVPYMSYDGITFMLDTLGYAYDVLNHGVIVWRVHGDSQVRFVCMPLSCGEYGLLYPITLGLLWRVRLSL